MLSAVRWYTRLAGKWSTQGTPCPVRLWSRWVSEGSGPHPGSLSDAWDMACVRCVQMGTWLIPADSRLVLTQLVPWLHPEEQTSHGTKGAKYLVRTQLRMPGVCGTHPNSSLMPISLFRERCQPPHTRSHSGGWLGRGSSGKDTQVVPFSACHLSCVRWNLSSFLLIPREMVPTARWDWLVSSRPLEFPEPTLALLGTLPLFLIIP